MNTAAAHPVTAAPAFTALDNQRLTLYYRGQRDLLGLADTTHAALVELVAWINQPHIAAAIACIDHHRALGRADAAAENTAKALAQPTDPVETRRNANLLLRIIRPPAPRRPRATKDASGAAPGKDTRDTGPQDSGPRTPPRTGVSSRAPAGASASPSSAPTAPAPPPGSAR
jgi:hypothetical protein